MAGVDVGRSSDGQDFPEIEDNVVKVLVVGNKGCGKTTFIHTFGGHKFKRVYIDRGTIVYLYDCSIRGKPKQFAFIEIPGLYGVQHVSERHANASGCIFMYAIDDPSSFRDLPQWIVSFRLVLASPSVVRIVVGFKSDLRKNPKAIYNLELENVKFITERQGLELVAKHKMDAFFGCSKFNRSEMVEAFNFILQNA